MLSLILVLLVIEFLRVVRNQAILKHFLFRNSSFRGIRAGLKPCCKTVVRLTVYVSRLAMPTAA